MSTTDTDFQPLPVDEELLKHLVPIRDLQPEDRLHLARKTKIIELPPGDFLQDADEHRWLLYLVEGALELIDRDRHTVKLRTDESRAHHALFAERSHGVKAVAMQRSKIARFDRQLFSTLMEQEIISGEQLETIEVGEVEGNIFNAIMHAFNQGQLKLPSLPEIALKIKTAASNPNASIQDVVRIVEADPAMVARLMQVANSPISRGIEPVKTIRDAIVRLGLATTRNLVVSLSMKLLFKTRSPMLRSRMHDLYDHSVEVAAISYAIGKRCSGLEADELLLAGLVHDIGVIPILTYIDDTGLEIENRAEIEHIIDKLRGVVGSMVIRNWDFAPQLATVVECGHDWSHDAGSELCMCDVVIIAQIYYLLKNHQLDGLPPIDKVPAFRKLFKDKSDPQFVVKVLEEAHEEISEVMKILRM